VRKKIIITLCAILGVSAIAVVVALTQPSLLDNILDPSSNKVSEPDELLQQYFSYIADGQYEDMYEMLTEQDREYIRAEDFITKNKSIYGGIEAKNIKVTITQVRDDAESDATRKIVDYSLRMDTLAGEISYTNQAVFTQNENKEYRMQWTTHTIFPNLNPDDRVRVKTLSATRGCIYDRNGEMLAGPGTASAIGLVPGKMRKEETALPDSAETNPPVEPESTGESDNADTKDTDTPESTPTVIYNAEDIAKVAELLEMTPESVIKKLNASYVKDDTFVQLRIVSKDAKELKEEILTVKGIMISDTTVRYYSLGEKASHLVGYIQGINAEELEVLREQGYHMNSILGKAGLERIYENELRAVDGYEIIIVDSKGSAKVSLAKKDKTDGKDIKLTIDAQIQSQLYDLFSTDKSCSVAMNPKTGEVLALVSTPTYDANDFVLGMPSSKWTALNEDENKPMYNRFKAAQCPGSTMKAITAAIGLNTGVIAPTDDFGHSGKRWQKDGSWGGYSITTLTEYNEPANIENALVYSDNIFFGKAALKIGGDTFAAELKRVGFEEKIPFEYALYSSIVSSTEDFSSEIQLADSGFGQGQILTNPIHLAAIYASFLNGGDILRPQLISGSQPEVWIDNAFTPETASIMRNSLIQVVERGTAKEARVPGVTLAAKTGTAEIKLSQDDETGTELGWFVEFTADENAPTPLLVATMVEDVKNRGGSHYVVPKVKTLFE
jgi:penicillin-binding protein